MSTPPELQLVDADGADIWRVGRAPDPWAWIDHRYAGTARWDDPNVAFRTTYGGDSLFASIVELLAYSRPDRNDDGTDLLFGVVEDAADATNYTTPPAGAVPRHWVTGRMIGAASLSGLYVDVRAAATVATLRPRYFHDAMSLGFDDFDAPALKLASPRDLTQRLAQHFYAMVDAEGEPAVDGVRFASRHGDDLGLWAIFERPGDEPSSRRLSRIHAELVRDDDPALLDAMALLGLTWTAR